MTLTVMLYAATMQTVAVALLVYQALLMRKNDVRQDFLLSNMVIEEVGEEAAAAQKEEHGDPFQAIYSTPSQESVFQVMKGTSGAQVPETIHSFHGGGMYL